ncbi:hypothetical protein F0L68_37580 [Solihabitans fulvus]|uniref:Anti-sigma-K factor rskA n=2 Tax=Solihabitans fulvus TaxID=1892852 RepID=A0A5B2WHP4_9PSEU|nr:hypothetical protein F0L68_37580 [Solihabitans fulvus]
MDPPWSVDLLADLHAGVLDAATEATLWPRVEADPDAVAVLAALDATIADLTDLPPLRMPDHVAARIDAALAAEANGRAAVPTQSASDRGRPIPFGAGPTGTAPPRQADAPVVDLAEARRRRNRRVGWGAGVLVAAAAAVGVVMVTLPGVNSPTTGTPNAQSQTPSGGQTSAQPPLAVQGGNLGAAVPKIMQNLDYGSLGTADRLAGCLRGGGIANTKPIGAGPITLDGRPALMAVLPSGKLGEFRVVVVDPATCGPDNPKGVLGNSVIAPPASGTPTR